MLGLIVLGTLRRVLPLIERAEASLGAAAASVSHGGLPLGASVPSFTANEVGGATFTEADLDGARTIVLFLSPSCRACERLVADLEQGDIPDLGARLVAVSDDHDQAREFVQSDGVVVLVQEGRSLAGVFGSVVTPHAFVLDEARHVLASGISDNWESLRRLVVEAERGGGKESDVAAATVASQEYEEGFDGRRD